ncbi:hypothetical protein PHLCEN_2v10199 [Hermanssonia centrifuga]|uniref:Uncharacterized protein n=1 Tax=Hermanssonia centrifuga TaxID=98765 RepID=A0A2R6NNT7_9APHY|nr:hypothetical protein PHLCEN_2v10199 [Hermanssonia centrifuga]
MREILFARTPSRPILHLENPSRQPWSEILETIGAVLDIPRQRSVPFSDWLLRVKAVPDAVANPCVKILPFLEDEFLRMATGKVVLDMKVATSISSTMRGSAAITEEQLRSYVNNWKTENFLE